MKKRKNNKERLLEGVIKNKNEINFYLVFLRYIILLFLAIFIPLIYFVFTKITIYPVVFLLKIFYNVDLFNNLVVINSNIFIEIIPSCIAGAAYLLLLILNLAIPMNIKKRILSILFSMLIFLIINILRIFIFSLLFINKFEYFDITHKIFWYGLSTIIVVGIWFLIVRIYKIKEIPIYTDIKNIYGQIKNKNKEYVK